jgi:hypothetical protein
MATVVTLHSMSQSAMACKSAVNAPKERTGRGSRPSGTQTECRVAPTSIPAAFTLTCCNSAGNDGADRGAPPRDLDDDFFRDAVDFSGFGTDFL